MSYPQVSHHWGCGMNTKNMHIWAAAGILCFGAGLSAPSPAMAAETAARLIDFDIKAQPVESALLEFSRQADMQVQVGAVSLAGQVTQGVKGKLEVEQALEELLRNTGLKADTRGHVVTIGAAKTGSEGIDQSLRLAQTYPLDSAQSSVEGQAEANEQGQRDNSASAGMGKSGSELEEIIVTAQKRQESLQDVPISISVLSGQNLESPGVVSVADALSTVPGVSLAQDGQSGGSAVTIRGVAPGGPLFFGGPTAGYYLDSVPFGLARQGFSPDSNAYDLERVEVLRGPQGTLYGASALNGVVRVLTANPNLNEFELKARTTASTTKGGDASYRGDVAINLPMVAGKFAARFVAGYEDRGGWIDRPNLNEGNANDGEINNYRLKLRAQPVDNLTIDLAAWLSREDYDENNSALEDRTHNSPLHEPVSVDYDLYGLTVGYDFDAFSLTSATSHLTFENSSVNDFSWATGPGTTTSINTLNESEVLAQEVTLQSIQEGPWRWTIGGFYRDSDEPFSQTFNDAPPFPVGYYKSESFAVFGELTRAFSDGRFEVTAGLRYFEDDQAFYDPLTAISVPGSDPYDATTFDALSPRLVLTWHPGNRTMLYGSYSEGFRSGNTGNPYLSLNGIPPLKPDTLKNYEMGSKGELIDGRLSYDVAIYYMDWQDIQQSLTITSPVTGIPGAALVNGDSASGLGVDLGLAVSPTDGLTLGVNFSWNDLTLDKPVIAASSGGDFVLAEAGERIQLSPEYTVSASAEYTFALGGGYDGRFAVSANYMSEQVDRSSLLGFPLSATGDEILVGRIGLTIDAPRRNWSATLFANNVTNEDGAVYRSAFTAFTGDLVARPRPRTIGVQLDYRFGK